jgi:phage shock protein PspC (stress-responsive transcriptional regulator)
MKQVININFHGRVIPIEVSAFELLKNYTDSLNRYFANEEGKEEIINDIENRISELFQQRLTSGITCITDDDVNAVIKSIGRPEDFESQETAIGTEEKTNDQNTSAAGTYKRLYRDENNKVFGGVCSGMANYFGIDPVIMRVIAVILFGVAFVPYIILWIVVPSSASSEIGGTRKKLYRDSDDKKIAGVCSGLANYFGVSPWIPRVIFLVPFLSFILHWDIFDFHNFWHFSFSPGALIIYIILWLVVPEATTTAEKLEMKGEKVDIHSIKNSVMEEIKGVKQRAEKFATDNKHIVADMGNTAKRTGRSVGDVLVLILKIFAYFIIGCVAFSLVISLLAVALAAIGIFPAASNFLLREGWQTILAWGVLLFFISVPVIGIITWIIRRLAKMKRHGKTLRLTFISLWIVGWVCVIGLIASLSKDFRTTTANNSQTIVLNVPTINKLEITTANSSPKYYHTQWFKWGPFVNLEDDTIYLKNLDVHIVRAFNDSFKVTMVKIASGANRHAADVAANAINFNVVQKDSLLLLDRGIELTKENKFRNQRIALIVYVPVGKQIRIDENISGVSTLNFAGYDDDLNMDIENESKDWDEGVDYIMKADGLYTLDGKPASGQEDNDSKTKMNNATNDKEDDDTD